jgi:HAD superfamily hydrolase (TIGR01450 family)
MRRFAAYLFDLDGVIYRGRDPLPGAVETVCALAERAKVGFLTNNSALHREDVAARLFGMGLTASVSNIYTSGYVAARRMAERSHRTAMVVGERGLMRELAEQGIESREHAPVDAVVVGRDTGFSFPKLVAAQQAVLSSAAFYATNRDPTYPVEQGVEPGSGCIVAAVAAAVEREPEVFGKPEPDIAALALAEAGVEPGEGLLVGDRLDTDILCGRRAGVATAVVLTGVTDRQMAEQAPEEMRPDFVISRLPELL